MSGITGAGMSETELKFWARSCLAKRRYSLVACALKGIAKYKRKGQKRYYYYCRYCAGYHLTSRPQDG